MNSLETQPTREAGIAMLAKMYGQRVPVGAIERPGPSGTIGVQVYLITEAWWCESRAFGEIEWATQYAAPEDAIVATDAERDDPQAAFERMMAETSMLIKSETSHGRKFITAESSSAFVRTVLRFERERAEELRAAVGQHGKSESTIEDFLRSSDE